MSETQKQTQNSYKIAIGNMGISVEAPTKDDCIALYQEVSQCKRKGPIEEAIR